MAEKLDQPEKLDFKNGYDLLHQIAEHHSNQHGKSVTEHLQNNISPLEVAVFQNGKYYNLILGSNEARLEAEVYGEDGRKIGHPEVTFNKNEDHDGSFNHIDWGISDIYPRQERFAELPNTPQQVYDIFVINQDSEPATVAQDS